MYTFPKANTNQIEDECRNDIDVENNATDWMPPPSSRVEWEISFFILFNFIFYCVLISILMMVLGK